MKISESTLHSKPLIPQNLKTSLQGDRVLSRFTQDITTILTLILTLLPLAMATGYLAFSAWTEASRFQSAPIYDHQRNPNEKGLFRIIGSLKVAPLTPKDFPEVKNALWYRVVSERRSKEGVPWHRDSTAPLVVQRVPSIFLGDVQVEIGLLSRLALPLKRVEKNISAYHRLAIEYKTLGIDEPLIAIGYLKGGVLKDGYFDRILIFTPKDEPETFQYLQRKSYHKVFFLGGISAIFLLLMLVMLPFLSRAVRHRKQSGHQK